MRPRLFLAIVACVLSCSLTSPISRSASSDGPISSDTETEESVYAMLQLSSRMTDSSAVSASQYFELIEDPLMNLLVSTSVSISEYSYV